MDLRSLFVSIGIVATGLGVIAPIAQRTLPIEVDSLEQLVLLLIYWTAGLALIGFGLLHPFKRGWVGAIIAILIQCVLALALN